MKKIKYIISFCIIFIGILIIGESHIFYLDNFYNQYDNTTMYLQLDTTSEQMKADTIQSSINNDVEIFTFKKSQIGTSNVSYDIYGTDRVKNIISYRSNIRESKYRSIFLGNITFNFKDFKSLTRLDKYNDYYVIGSKNNIKQFKMDLIDKYGGNHPKSGFQDKESVLNIIGIWTVIICLILVLTYYDILSAKKENIVRLTMGESIKNLFLKNIFFDASIYIAIFLLVISLLYNYTNVFFNFKVSLLLFGILIVLNSLLYINLYFYDIKDSLYNNLNSKYMLSVNYSLKTIATVITICIISSNLMFINEALNIYKQKDFFVEHSDYYYIKFSYRPTVKADGSMYDVFEDSAKVHGNFYREFFDQFNVLSLNYSVYNEIEYIYSNINSKDYLLQNIIELKNLDFKKDYYLFLPKSMKNNYSIVNELQRVIKFNEGSDFEYDYEVIYYNDNIKLVGIDENIKYGSKLIKNPAIIYNNLPSNAVVNQNSDEDLARLGFNYDLMYKISSDNDLKKFQNFIEANDLDGHIVNKINVFEKYQNNWILNSRILYINLVFSILFLFLELIIINSIIKLEYKVNAIELSIKKILGFNIYQKNKKIILLSFFTTITSVFISIIVSIALKSNDLFYITIGGLLVLIIELILITFYINKIEKSNIQRILKGEDL